MGREGARLLKGNLKCKCKGSLNVPVRAVVWHHVHCNAGVSQKKWRDMQPVCVLRKESVVSFVFVMRIQSLEREISRVLDPGWWRGESVLGGQLFWSSRDRLE